MSAVVAAIVGDEVESLEPLSSGGNSRTYRARTGSSSFLVKRYPPGDERPRLETERLALEQLSVAGLPVPGFVGSDADHQLAVHEWIDGEPVDAVSDADIDAVVALVHGAQRVAAPADFAPASAACLSIDEATAQLEARLLAASAIDDPIAASFVADELAPSTRAQIAVARRRAGELGLDTSVRLGHDRAILSPSDLGFHNAIRRPDGSLTFCDFEYFGWDDPAKLIADVTLHPALSVPRRQRAALVAGLWPLLDDERRLVVGLPLWRLCWCMILLNAYLPDRFGHQGDARRDERLADARRRLTEIETPWQF